MVKFTFRRKTGNKRKSWHKKIKKYAKKKMTIYKVPKQRQVSYKRERWFDLNLAQPGGQLWVDGRTHPDVLAENPLLNMGYNLSDIQNDPVGSRINWQPIFTLGSLPGLEDIGGLYRLFKVNKISITLYPFRVTNPIRSIASQAGDPVSSNITITTMYAKTGIDTRILMGTKELSQVERKTVKLYNLGVSDKKIGWYYTPTVNYNAYSNPAQSNTPTIQIPDPNGGPGTVDGVNVANCFAHIIKKPGFMDIQRSMNTDHYGPLISFRSVDGRSMAGGTGTDNNMKFQARITCYFTCKGVH